MRARRAAGSSRTFDGLRPRRRLAIVALIADRPGRDAATPEQTAEVGDASDVRRRRGDASAYERGLKLHLASTEQQLAGLDSATPEERARLIETIIAQNRIYALAAERAGEPQLARVLRAFAPVLESWRRTAATRPRAASRSWASN